MKRVLVLLALVACSNAGELADGVIAIDIILPNPSTLDYGDTAKFVAIPLDQNGDSVAAGVVWRTPDDSTITIIDSALGLVIGNRPGVGGRVQANLGDYHTGLDSVRFQARADTLVFLGPASTTVAADAGASDSLTARLQSFDPPDELLSGRPMIFRVVEPVFADPAQAGISLPNGQLVDTVTTGPGGTPSPFVTLSRRLGMTAPDSAVVQVEAYQALGAQVPGSGQRYVVHFE